MATVQSGWCAQPLQLNGILDAARWGGAGSMDVPNLGSILVQNDAQFLYVGLDMVKDTGNDAGTGDYFWLSFDVDKNKAITPNVDVNYGLYPNQQNHIGKQLYLGPGKWTGLLQNSGACECHAGFGASLKSGVAHRMWEIKVPLADIGGTLNATPAHVFTGLRVNSKTPALTVDVPPGFSGNFSALTEVLLMKDPAVQLNQILQANPQVAAAIQWQATPGSQSDAYAPPTPANMVAYANWTAQQKADLLKAFQVALQWILQGAPSVPPNSDGLTDAPTNVHPNINNDNVSVLQAVSASYMWSLYVNHVAFSLVHMASGVNAGGFPLAGLNAEELRWLLSSATMAWNTLGQYYGMGTYYVNLPALRANNRPSTPFAPPRWVYSWLRDNQLLGATRKETIYHVLDWMRHNMWHFFGAATFGNCQAIWQYRGYPPLSRIVTGTIDANNQGFGQQHWTMGCHGSLGFLNAILRVLNIPVLPVWVCGHELAYFPTEGLYMDHGDDPYNQNVKNSQKPISLVLIDAATYATRFSQDATVNLPGPGPECSNVGLTAQTFPQ
ncbi:MAG TPA: hypothetical protein VHI13_02450 [Candidatus Kapabacteria bacterium]|nr:hypothetical protein [Candidatus Kapabacteria bacterium]